MSDTYSVYQQPPLFTLPTPEHDDAIQARFESFHAANPHVYATLVGLARRLRERGVRQYAIAALFENMRWHSLVGSNGATYKLSNDYRSRYARLMMEREPELSGLFNLRDLTSW